MVNHIHPSLNCTYEVEMFKRSDNKIQIELLVLNLEDLRRKWEGRFGGRLRRPGTCKRNQIEKRMLHRTAIIRPFGRLTGRSRSSVAISLFEAFREQAIPADAWWSLRPARLRGAIGTH